VKMSDHLRLEIGVAFHRDYRPRGMGPMEGLELLVEGMDDEERRAALGKLMAPPALGPGEPVPGCPCPNCTGIPEDHPSRIPPRPRGWGRRGSREEWDRKVDRARSTPVLAVARSLGLRPAKTGRSFMCRCPFHDDKTPSLSIDTDKGLWHCFSCLRGGDGIGLYMKVRRLDFTDVVKELSTGMPLCHEI
jgi:hypothetical protein